MSSVDTESYTDLAAALSANEFAAPYVVVAMQCMPPHSLPARYSMAEVDQVVLQRGERLAHHREAATLFLELPDSWMSSSHARIRRQRGVWLLEDQQSKNGTMLNGLTVQREVLGDGDLIEVGQTLLLFRNTVARASDEPLDLEFEKESAWPHALRTLNPNLAAAFSALRQIARSKVPVLVHGDTGTGKELVARAVHQLSERTGSFTAINCGALAPTLLESELFGHKKGAFSGANRAHAGLIRATDGGTLFLDEVAELAERSQVALLRVLQEGEVLPLGATRPVSVDVRLVAATHRDLSARVACGTFREDLFARLAGHRTTLPKLRERREDLCLIVGEILARLGGARGKDICLSRRAARSLFAYEWPLNIRELVHVLRSALVRTDGNTIDIEHFPSELQAATLSGRPANSDARMEEVVWMLRQHRCNVSEVARQMNTSRAQVRRWIKRWDIDVAALRGEQA